MKIQEKVLEILRKAECNNPKATREDIFQEVEKIIDEYTRRKYLVHHPDECDCCEKNLSNIQELKQKLKGEGK